MPTLNLYEHIKYVQFRGIEIAKCFLRNFNKYNKNELINFFAEEVETEETNNYTEINFPENIYSQEDFNKLKENYNAKIEEDGVNLFLQGFMDALQSYYNDLMACQKKNFFICSYTKTDNHTLYCEMSLWKLDNYILMVPSELSFLKTMTFDSLFEKVFNTPSKYYNLISTQYNLTNCDFGELFQITHDDENCVKCQKHMQKIPENIMKEEEISSEDDEMIEIEFSDDENIMDILNEEAYGDEVSYYEEQQKNLFVINELPFKDSRNKNTLRNIDKEKCLTKFIYNTYYFMLLTFLNLYLNNHVKENFYLLTKDNFIKLQYKIISLLSKVSIKKFFNSFGSIIEEIKTYYEKIYYKQLQYEPIVKTQTESSKFLNKVTSSSKKQNKQKNVYPLGTIGYYLSDCLIIEKNLYSTPKICSNDKHNHNTLTSSLYTFNNNNDYL